MLLDVGWEEMGGWKGEEAVGSGVGNFVSYFIGSITYIKRTYL